MCPVLFKGSRSLLLLACCYVPIVRRMLIFKGGTWLSGNRAVIGRTGKALFIRLSVCRSIYVYLLSGLTCSWLYAFTYAYNLASGLIEFCCFGLPAALGRGQVGGGCQGHLGAWGVSPHTRTRMRTHAHAHTHMYTCIEIANGRRHGGIHV